ncbi:MAG TPA: hypothetical protein VMH39_06380 [Gemmatimonadaceae bacterium]|nr:hypothetical protein [Gemmatimonadaceae bacterium]
MTLLEITSVNARRTIIALAFALIGPAPRAAAQEPARDPHDVQPERPTVATHAGTVATGWFELETGIEDDQVGPSAHSYITPTLLKIGLASTLQVGIFAQLSDPSGAGPGLGDVGANLKWRLANGLPVLGDFAVLPSLKVPTGSATAGRGTGTTDASLVAISSHDFGPVEMDLNAGYTRRSGNGSVAPRNATLWTGSLGGTVAGALGWAAEVYGYPATSGPAGQSAIVALLAGPTLLARAWWAFDAGIIVPMRGPQPHAIYAGTVYNIGHLWGTPTAAGPR